MLTARKQGAAIHSSRQGRVLAQIGVDGDQFLGLPIGWVVLPVFFCTAIVFAVTMLLGGRTPSTEWMVCGIGVVGLYFAASRHLYRHFATSSEHEFVQQIVMVGAFVRVTGVVFTYLAFYQITGTPFEPDARDSVRYHALGIELSKQFSSGVFNPSSVLGVRGALNVFEGYSFGDYGFFVVIGFVYSVFGDATVSVRVLNVIVSTASVLLVYRIAKSVFGVRAGRLAGILGALSPYAAFYSGLHAKEPIMIFLILLAVDQFLVTTRRVSLRSVVAVGFALITLLFFRAFLPVILAFAFLVHVLVDSLSQRQLSRAAAGLVFLLVIGAGAVLSVGVDQALWDIYQRANANLDVGLASEQNRMAGEVSSASNMMRLPVLIAVGLSAPYPSIVQVPGVASQSVLAMQFPFAFVKNALLLFFVLGVFLCIRRRPRGSDVILVFVLSYAIALSISADVTSNRFQLVLLPFYTILASAGVSAMLGRNGLSLWWGASLAIMAVVGTVWNFAKLLVHGYLT